MNDIAARIAKAMEQQNISYGELARATGIPKSAVFRYVTGQTEKMPLPRLELIAKALHVEPSYLMGWDEEVTPQEKQIEELAGLFRKLPPSAQELVLAQLRGLVQSQVVQDGQKGSE